jgi:hypothetical protein
MKLEDKPVFNLDGIFEYPIQKGNRFLLEFSKEISEVIPAFGIKEVQNITLCNDKSPIKLKVYYMPDFNNFKKIVEIFDLDFYNKSYFNFSILDDNGNPYDTIRVNFKSETVKIKISDVIYQNGTLLSFDIEIPDYNIVFS